MRNVWLPIAVLAYAASGCTPIRTVYVDWSPALVDTIRTHAPTRFKSYGADEMKALDAREVSGAVEVLFEHHADWVHIPTPDIEYFIAPGPPRHRRGSSAVFGALLGGVILSKYASSSTKRACMEGDCAFAASGMAAAGGFMLGALGGAFTGLMIGNAPWPTRNRYTIPVRSGAR